jgi:hypothetical protein
MHGCRMPPTHTTQYIGVFRDADLAVMRGRHGRVNFLHGCRMPPCCAEPAELYRSELLTAPCHRASCDNMCVVSLRYHNNTALTPSFTYL